MKITILVDGRIIQKTTTRTALSMVSSLKAKGWEVWERYDIGRVEFRTPKNLKEALDSLEGTK